MKPKLFMLSAALAVAACESTGKTQEPPMAKAKAPYSTSSSVVHRAV